MQQPPTSQEDLLAIINQVTRSPEGKKFLHTLLSSTGPTELLECMGQHFSHWHLQETLCYMEQTPPQQAKLLAIFAGLPFTVFEQLMKGIEPAHLQLLQKIGHTEPLLHQLTLFSHRYELLYKEHCDEADALACEIALLEPLRTTSSEIQVLIDHIAKLQNACEQEQDCLAKVLSIAWNSGKHTLIESLSTLKERHYHLQQQVIGMNNSSTERCSGLYLKLEQQLAKAFGDPNETDFDILSNDDSPFEALAKFSLWFLKDYWDVGLLPSVSSLEQLEDLDESKNGRALSFRKEVERNLHNLGLTDVAAFKIKHIFSKDMLREFIASQRHKLTE